MKIWPRAPRTAPRPLPARRPSWVSTEQREPAIAWLLDDPVFAAVVGPRS